MNAQPPALSSDVLSCRFGREGCTLILRRGCPSLWFSCGQCFRFRQEEGEGSERPTSGTASGTPAAETAPDGARWWSGVAKGRPLRLRCLGRAGVDKDGQYAEGTEMFLERVDLHEFFRIWASYFDLGTAYEDMWNALPHTPELAPAWAYGWGMRVLHQELFETTVAFILSANNNVARIAGTVEQLCSRYGHELRRYGRVFSDFPTPEALAEAGEEDIRAAGAGYRSRYVIETAARFAEGFSIPDDMDFDACIAELMTLPGVGLKVAHCIALFALHRLESFPVDRWIRRGLDAYGGSIRDIPSPGYAQQMLFHALRQGVVNTEASDAAPRGTGHSHTCGDCCQEPLDRNE